MALSGVLGNVLGDGDHAPVDDVRLDVTYNNGGLVGTVAAGDPPDISDVRNAVVYDNGNLTGNLVVPSVNDVRAGTTFDTLSSLTGLLDLPSINDTRLGVAFDQTTKVGNVRVPPVGNVQLGYTYDTLDSLTGTYDPSAGGYPAESDVRLATVFGDSSQYTGQLDLPSVDDVRLGVTFDSTTKTGNVRIPPVENVLLGYAYDTNDSLTGILDAGSGYPAEVDVRLSTMYGSANEFTGELDLPNIDKVRAGVEFDSLTKMGNSVAPPEARVEQGTGYGSLGTEFTGTLDPGAAADLPGVEDVRFGIEFGNAETGVLQSPTPAQVLVGVGYGAYGTEFEGTLTDTPGGGAEPQPPVMTSGQLRSPLIIGDSYTDPTNPFIWQIPAPAGMTSGGATATFSGSRCCEVDEWTSTGTITEAAGIWTLTFELTTAETAAIVAGDHTWSVQLEEGDIKFSAARGDVAWACR